MLRRKTLAILGTSRIKRPQYGTVQGEMFSVEGAYYSCCGGIRVVRQSGKNNSGMLASRVYRANARAGRRSWVKDTHSLNGTQGMYIRKQQQRAATESQREQESFLAKYSTSQIAEMQNKPCCKMPRIGLRAYPPTRIKYFQPQGLSQGHYLHTGLLTSKCLPPPRHKEHFPMLLNNKYCSKTILTYEDAKAAGYYKKCSV